MALEPPRPQQGRDALHHCSAWRDPVQTAAVPLRQALRRHGPLGCSGGQVCLGLDAGAGHTADVYGHD